MDDSTRWPQMKQIHTITMELMAETMSKASDGDSSAASRISSRLMRWSNTSWTRDTYNSICLNLAFFLVNPFSKAVGRRRFPLLKTEIYVGQPERVNRNAKLDKDLYYDRKVCLSVCMVCMCVHKWANELQGDFKVKNIKTAEKLQ